MLSHFLNKEELFNKPKTNFLPKANISEGENEFSLSLAVPGMAKEDLKINLEDNVLSISAEIKPLEEEANYSRREFKISSFSRSFYLPEDVQCEKIEATFENGILNLIIPKVEVVVLKKEISIK